MRSYLVKSRATAFVLFALSLLPLCSQAGVTVLPGWDLQITQPGTTYSGVSFQGVPLGTFNFGGGAQNVGNADTIVRGLDPASAPSTAIDAEIVALQLVSSAPADFGLGLGTYYMTLQSARGGPASVGGMTISFGPEAPAGGAHGTFDSFFDVFFDIRFGSLVGPITASDHLVTTSNGVPWNHFAPVGAVLINGVNNHLNGVNRDADFWPVGSYSQGFAGGAQVVAPATAQVPDGGSSLSLLLIVSAFLGLGRLWQIRRPGR